MSPAAVFTDDDAVGKVLRSADELFYGRGVVATSMADVRDASGVSMRRIYRLYPTKSDLVSGWLRRRHTDWLNWFELGVETRIEDGADPIDAVLDLLAAWLRNTDYRGCGFINTLAEASDVTDEHRRIINDHKRSLVAALAHYSPDPDATAVIVDGAIVRCAVEQSTAPIEHARRAAHAVAASRLSSPSYESSPQ